MTDRVYLESTSGLLKVEGEPGSKALTRRRDFLGYMGGIAIVAGLSPGDWICGPSTLPQPATGLPMAPGLDPHLKGPTPFAVILCRFNDLPALTIPSSVFSDYVAGPGKGGVFDYYRDTSYGMIDLTGSKVFGWYTMKYSFFKDGSDPYHGSADSCYDPKKLQSRCAWVKEAIRLANENHVSLSSFYGVIAVVNANVDDSNDGGRNLALGIKADWGQNNWRWCNKCQGLAYGGNPPGPCPTSGSHDLSSSGDYTLAMDMPTFPGQSNWRWCKKCGGLAFAGITSAKVPSVVTVLSGDPTGRCPAGGGHDYSASADYRLAMGKVGFPGQNNWKWCSKCQGLAYAGSKSGPGDCPAGARHLHASSGDYTLVTPPFGYENHLNTAFGAHEIGHCFGLGHAHCAGVVPPADNWDYCDPWDIMGAGTGTYSAGALKFSPVGPGLNAGNLSRLGWIKEDRIYSASGSRTHGETITLAALSRSEAKGYLMARIITPDRIFAVEYRQRDRWDRGLADDAVVVHELRSPFILGQNNWKWCSKCQGLAYSGFGAGPCPAKGAHDHSGSGDYGLVHDMSDFKGQNNWRWCNKCQGLVFAGAGAGACPASGVHDLSRSFDYIMIADSNRFAGQNNWRWCKKCQGLAYAGLGTGACPAGDKHDQSSSGDYTLPNFGDAEPFLLKSLTTGQRWADLLRGVSAVVDRINPGTYSATVII